MKRVLAVIVLGLSLTGCVYSGPGPGYYAAPGYHYYYYP
jgi:hypothetical protein